MKMSEKLSKEAQKLAEEMVENNKVTPTIGVMQGVNVLGSWTPKDAPMLSGAEVVERWYKEVEHHVYHSVTPIARSGNFTQLIWRASKTLGVGYGRDSMTGRVVVVAIYAPPGNIEGHYEANVPPP